MAFDQYYKNCNIYVFQRKVYSRSYADLSEDYLYLNKYYVYKIEYNLVYINCKTIFKLVG